MGFAVIGTEITIFPEILREENIFWCIKWPGMDVHAVRGGITPGDER